MEKTTWKILAIIFFILFMLETSLFIFGTILAIEEFENEEWCYESCIYEGYEYYILEGNSCECVTLEDEGEIP